MFERYRKDLNAITLVQIRQWAQASEIKDVPSAANKGVTIQAVVAALSDLTPAGEEELLSIGKMFPKTSKVKLSQRHGGTL